MFKQEGRASYSYSKTFFAGAYLFMKIKHMTQVIHSQMITMTTMLLKTVRDIVGLHAEPAAFEGS